MIRKQPRRRWITFVAVVSLVVTTLGIAGTAFANLSGSTFEGGDGNLVVDTAGNTDWFNAPNRVALNDQASGQNDNSFGQGTKEANEAVTVVSGSIPNSKADLGRFGAAFETRAAGVFLYLAWARNNLSGSTNFDFEINQAAQPNLTTPGAKTLNRTTGDVLILYDFQGGSQRPTISLSRWLANDTWSTPAVLPPTQAEAEVNRTAAVSDFLAAPTTSRPAFAFGEAAINLTAAGVFPAGQCESFGSIFIKSRASNAFNAEVKDFIAPIPVSINNCATLIVKKVTVPSPDPGDASFAFSETGPGSFTDSFNLKDGEQDSNTGLTPGTYTAAETDPGPNYTLTSATCSDGSPVTAIDLGAGETVTCTFTNTLQTGAIEITKLRKHAAAEGTDPVPQAGVTFTIDGVTTSATGSDGKVCVAGLSLGNHTVHENVPTGYHGEADKVINVTTGNCTTGAVATTFTNTPLTDVSITVNSQVNGGTASTIDCDNDALDGSTNANGDVTVSPTDLEPQTITCTIVIDP